MLFTGKGGVGKTSVAAATAARVAARGSRVLVTSTDPAHSLADALATPLGPRPTSVRHLGDGLLFGQQLDARERLEHHWRDVRDYLVHVLAWSGLDEVAAEELILLPGLDELFALVDLHDQVRHGGYDLVVVDCAPTAETLKLLSLPDALRWYRDRVGGPGRRFARAVGPLARSFGVGGGPPAPEDGVVDALDRLHGQLVDVHDLLTDPARTSVRLVVNPERLVLAEAQRSATTLSLFGYALDAVVVNRVLPDTVTDPFLTRWQQRHVSHLAAARRAFGPTPVLTAPMLDDEPAGLDDLTALGEALYGERDPARVLHEDRPVVVEQRGEVHLLRVALPFATEDDLRIHQAAGELYVEVGGVRRNVPLPAALRRRDIVGARLDGTVLEVRFVDPVPASPTATDPRPDPVQP